MIRIEISSDDKVGLYRKLTQQNDIEPMTGTTYHLERGVELTYLTGMGRNMTSSEWIHLGIGLLAGIPFNMLAAWLYDQVKNDTTIRLVINGSSIPLDEKKIAQILKVMYNNEEE